MLRVALTERVGGSPTRPGPGPWRLVAGPTPAAACRGPAGPVPSHQARGGSPMGIRTPFHVSSRRPGARRAAARAALAGLALLALAGACNRESGGKAAADGKEPIRVGHFASLTGDTATFGQSADRGIRMALDEVNAR